MNQPDHVDVTAYVVLTPKWHDHWKDRQGRRILSGARMSKTTATQPTIPAGGGVATKVTFRVPASVFLPLLPEAIIELDPSTATTILVSATDPELADRTKEA